VLAELKAALGHDPVRFARTVARPVVVERLLRARFENNDRLHAPQRREAEAIRQRLLATVEAGFAPRLVVLKEAHAGEVTGPVKWEFTPRPAGEGATAATIPAGPTSAKATAGLYTNEATAQVSQVLSSQNAARDAEAGKLYFEDLPAELQTVLRLHLRQPGDVSAVIETRDAFQVYLGQERTANSLTATICTLRKRNYEEWLAAQPEP
jgi:hypothetical protein